MKGYERTRPQGRLRLTIRDHGRVEVVEVKNVITDDGNTMFAHLAAGSGTAIGTVGVGSDPTPAAPEDTALTDAFTKALTLAEFTGTGQVKFTFTIDQGDAVGLDIQEFGLLAGTTLCARRVYAIGTKTDHMQIDGEWTIEFA